MVKASKNLLSILKPLKKKDEKSKKHPVTEKKAPLSKSSVTEKKMAAKKIPAHISIASKPAKKSSPKKSVAKTPNVKPDAVSANILDDLFEIVTSRRTADPAISHSARLLARGRNKIAQKFGEEAVECLIEAASGNTKELIAESADVLYHLIVVWVDAGLHPSEIWTELAKRQGISGIEEKASRPVETFVVSLDKK